MKNVSVLTALCLGMVLPNHSFSQANSIQINQIAGKNQQEVARVLGASEGCETVRPSRIQPSPKCMYRRGQVEIVFINGRADWITINIPNRLFNPSSIAEIGLPLQGPSVINENIIRWDNAWGFRSVTIAPGGAGRAAYVYVKAQTQ